MENFITNIAVFIVRFMVVGFYTLAYVTPLFLLFYLLIFQNTELLSEISVKSYIISCFIGFVLNYKSIVGSVKKDKKTENKGV